MGNIILVFSRLLVCHNQLISDAEVNQHLTDTEATVYPNQLTYPIDVNEEEQLTLTPLSNDGLRPGQ
jgi:hypothetical protein